LNRHDLSQLLYEIDLRGKVTMSSIFDRMRSGAEKAAFEADKQRRVLAIQQNIRPLKKEFDTIIVQAGHVVYALHRQGKITQPELLEVCAKLDAIQSSIKSQEEQIQQIRDEIFVDPRIQEQYGRVCPHGHGPIAPGANFCGICGSPPVEVQSSSVSYCQNCRYPLDPEALFCAKCGQPVKQPAQVDPPPITPTATCKNCGSPLQPDAVFCSECGHTVAPKEPPSPVILDEHKDVIVPPPFVQAKAAAEPLPHYDEPGVEEPTPVVVGEAEEIDAPPPVVDSSVVPETLTIDGEPVEDEPEVALSDEDKDGDELPVFMDTEPPLPDDALTQDIIEVVLPDDGDESGDIPPIIKEDETETTDTADSSAPIIAESTSVCPACNADLLPDALFCAECGRPVLATKDKSIPEPPSPDLGSCPNCGMALLPEATFCAECGHSVS
jgi:predicted amidophosphoribosyltransferase